MPNKLPSRLAAQQAGFTLIELIIVIVIIGILAAVAIPKYLDLTDSAKQAVVDGIASNIASASATNYSIRSGLPGKGTKVTGCDDTSFKALLDTLPAGAAATAGAPDTACTVDYNGATSAPFVIKVIS